MDWTATLLDAAGTPFSHRLYDLSGDGREVADVITRSCWQRCVPNGNVSTPSCSPTLLATAAYLDMQQRPSPQSVDPTDVR